METVEVVVRINKDEYNFMKHFQEIKAFSGHYIAKQIVNGTVLPEGHGRLADMDAAMKCLEETADCKEKQYAIGMLEWAMAKRTVIEADSLTIRDERDCKHCSRTYGTLGCCSTVSNKWIYSCEEGHREYEETQRLKANKGADNEC